MTARRKEAVPIQSDGLVRVMVTIPESRKAELQGVAKHMREEAGLLLVGDRPKPRPVAREREQVFRSLHELRAAASAEGAEWEAFLKAGGWQFSSGGWFRYSDE